MTKSIIIPIWLQILAFLASLIGIFLENNRYTNDGQLFSTILWWENVGKIAFINLLLGFFITYKTSWFHAPIWRWLALAGIGWCWGLGVKRLLNSIYGLNSIRDFEVRPGLGSWLLVGGSSVLCFAILVNLLTKNTLHWPRKQSESSL